MSPIALLLHIGGILKTVRDVEQTVSDLIKSQPTKDDIKNVLEDIAALVVSGVISIPGVTSDQIAGAIADLEKII